MFYPKIMKTLLIPVALLTMALFLSSGCATSHPHPAAWEYKVVSSLAEFDKRQSAFNDLGKDGWEFVAVGPNGDYYFKRPKK
jgi:hypothetical protein